MPLILSMNEGEDFYVGQERFLVENVGLRSFEIARAVGGYRLFVNDLKMVELLPDVKISCGLGNTDRVAKLVIDAPRSIPIMQGSRYRKART